VEGKGRVKEGRRKGRERTVGGGSVGERYPPGEGAESKPGAKTMDEARSGSGAHFIFPGTPGTPRAGTAGAVDHSFLNIFSERQKQTS
jgi:hypothetical protein